LKKLASREVDISFSGGFLILRGYMNTAHFFEILGIAGSLIMCVSVVPQIIKTYRKKNSDGLSISYLIILMTGMSMIMLYALYVKDMVFIFGNGLALLLTGILVVLWYRYRNEKTEDIIK
jgi:MtN3 and saliva related transmembrane protein